MGMSGLCKCVCEAGGCVVAVVCVCVFAMADVSSLPKTHLPRQTQGAVHVCVCAVERSLCLWFQALVHRT